MKVTIRDEINIDDSAVTPKIKRSQFRMPNFNITADYLNINQNVIFVFGDNTIRKGLGGAAVLRNCKNTYGFITKKLPNNNPTSFFTLAEYLPIFQNEWSKLLRQIEMYPNKLFLISRLGGGLANKHKIFENIIEPNLLALDRYPNVTLLF